MGEDSTGRPTTPVLTGLERWLDEGPAVAKLGRGAKIGLVAHPASVDSRAFHAVERFAASSDVRLVRLFAPEHGLWGREQDMERVEDALDPLSGTPVVSLYGNDPGSLKPTRAHLEDLDAVLVDLQDVGSRYYTFAYTMSYVMEAARPLDLPVVVLDRPNPLGGERVEGPVLHPDLSSFVGRYPLPVQHGMSLGELAKLFNTAFGIGCDLRVVGLRGWKRAMTFASTGLPWVAPSPNMPSLATVQVYPGGCLIEGTNLSEGRGTTTPFELVGAPWLDGPALARMLRSCELPGVRFRPAAFRPMFHKHANEVCEGIQVVVEKAETFRPFLTYLALLIRARAQAPEHFAWREEAYEFERSRKAIELLLGRPELLEQVETGAPLAEIERTWIAGLASFVEQRREFLLYD